MTGIRTSVGNEERIDYVVAVVNDQAITWTELRSALVIRAFVDPLVSLLPPLLDELRNPSDEAQRTILDILIDRTLMLQEAERMGILLARWHEKVAIDMEGLKRSYPSKSVFFERLKLSGLEYAELKEWRRADLIIDNLIFRKFINSIDEEKIEQEALQHFEQHKTKYSEAQKAYAEVKDEIKRMLIEKQVDEQMKKWLAEQKKIVNWRILDSSLSSALSDE